MYIYPFAGGGGGGKNELFWGVGRKKSSKKGKEWKKKREKVKTVKRGREQGEGRKKEKKEKDITGTNIQHDATKIKKILQSQQTFSVCHPV